MALLTIKSFLNISQTFWTLSLPSLHLFTNRKKKFRRRGAEGRGVVWERREGQVTGHPKGRVFSRSSARRLAAGGRVARQKPNRCEKGGFRCRYVYAKEENKKFWNAMTRSGGDRRLKLRPRRPWGGGNIRLALRTQWRRVAWSRWVCRTGDGGVSLPTN